MFYVWMWDLMGNKEPKVFNHITQKFFMISFFNEDLDIAFEMFFSEELN